VYVVILTAHTIEKNVKRGNPGGFSDKVPHTLLFPKSVEHFLYSCLRVDSFNEPGRIDRVSRKMERTPSTYQN